MDVPSARAPEFDLLCALARPHVDALRARELLRAGLDEDRLLQFAAAHSVRSHLIRGLARIGWEDVPATLHARLDAFRHEHLLASLSFVAEVRRVGERLERDGIEFITFKGVALATHLYGDPSAREYVDIDLLVPPGRVHAAEASLAALGYRSPLGEWRVREAFLGYQRQYQLLDPDTGRALDLHWDFGGDHLPFPIGAGEVWSDGATVSFGDRRLRTLAGANLALLLAGHGTKEQWRSLELVCDFAWLVDRHPELDWHEIHRRAAARHSGRSVLLGALLAERLLGVPVPPPLRDAVDRQAGLSGRASELIAVLAGNVSNGGSYFTDLELCDRPVDRLRGFLNLSLRPTTSDYRALPLPPALWPLYYLTRPLRLAAQAAGRLF
jgi:Uncharacterised nucleotidyltransferase